MGLPLLPSAGSWIVNVTAALWCVCTVFLQAKFVLELAVSFSKGKFVRVYFCEKNFF